jgi:hypothetical protein
VNIRDGACANLAPVLQGCVVRELFGCQVRQGGVIQLQTVWAYVTRSTTHHLLVPSVKLALRAA